MKKLTLSLILGACAAVVNAQRDTTFFDKEWNVIVERDEMAFFRVSKSQGNNMWEIHDYYGNGVVQMLGHFQTDDPNKLLNFDDNNKYQNGLFRYYYKSGKLDGEGLYKNGEKVGEWKYYYDTTGVLAAVHKYTDEKGTRYSTYYDEKGRLYSEGGSDSKNRQGPWKFYYPDKKMGKVEENYKNGLLNGEKNYYYADGKLKRREIYIDDMMESGKCYSEKGNEIPFYPYWVRPEPGFDFAEFLNGNLKYPKTAQKEDIQGIVQVKFKVNDDGTIKDVESLSPEVDSRLQKEAIRVIASMPKWTPGKEDGKPVSIYYTQPIIFKLTDDKN